MASHDPVFDWENQLLDSMQGSPLSFDEVNEMLEEARAEISRGEFMKRTIPEIIADAFTKTK